MMRFRNIACILLFSALSTACGASQHPADGNAQATARAHTVCPDGYTGDLVLSGNDVAALDAFAQSGCTHLTGNLDMRGFSAAQWPDALSKIQQVDGSIFIRKSQLARISLPNLRSVGGQPIDAAQQKANLPQGLLIDENPNLTTIESAGALRTIGGNLAIGSNPKLTTIGDFQALETVGGLMAIGSNPVLTHLPTFNALQRIGNSLAVTNNKDLAAIDGFAHLQNIGRHLLIAQNTSLQRIDTFATLTHIGKDLRVLQNPQLETLPPFPSLATIGGNLGVSANQRLHTIGAFKKLTTIGQSLGMGQNPKLTAMGRFPALTSIGKMLAVVENTELIQLSPLSSLRQVGSMYIIDNTKLPTCALQALVDRVRITKPQKTVIGSNNEDPTACDSAPQRRRLPGVDLHR